MSENTTSGSEFLERDEDVEGHRIAFADGGSENPEDTEGHKMIFADGPDAEDDVEGHRAQLQGTEDDVEGHRAFLDADAEEDTEGHRYLTHKVDAGDEDDVEGHVQPRRDIDVER